MGGIGNSIVLQHDSLTCERRNAIKEARRSQKAAVMVVAKHQQWAAACCCWSDHSIASCYFATTEARSSSLLSIRPPHPLQTKLGRRILTLPDEEGRTNTSCYELEGHTSSRRRVIENPVCVYRNLIFTNISFEEKGKRAKEELPSP